MSRPRIEDTRPFTTWAAASMVRSVAASRPTHRSHCDDFGTRTRARSWTRRGRQRLVLPVRLGLPPDMNSCVNLRRWTSRVGLSWVVTCAYLCGVRTAARQFFVRVRVARCRALLRREGTPEMATFRPGASWAVARESARACATLRVNHLWQLFARVRVRRAMALNRASTPRTPGLSWVAVTRTKSTLDVVPTSATHGTQAFRPSLRPGTHVTSERAWPSTELPECRFFFYMVCTFECFVQAIEPTERPSVYRRTRQYSHRPRFGRVASVVRTKLALCVRQLTDLRNPLGAGVPWRISDHARVMVEAESRLRRFRILVVRKRPLDAAIEFIFELSRCEHRAPV